MSGEGKGKPVFCGKDGKWKDELEKRLPTDDEIAVLALGDVKYGVLRYLNNRKALEMLKLPSEISLEIDNSFGAVVSLKHHPGMILCSLLALAGL